MIVALYARYSSENQSEESITAQIRAGTEYCIRNGHTVVEHYIDRAMTARSDKRPEFQRMIADAKTGKFKGIIVHKLDRFSRDRMDSALYRKELEKQGVQLISVLEKLDDSPESALMTGVIESVNEFYSRNLARETRKGLKEVALQAKTTGGTLLYGYELTQDGHYKINEAEAAVIRRVFQANLDGTGYDKLLAEFRREGLKTRRGNEFTKNTFYYWLKNPRYKGDYVYSPEGEQKYGRCKPIVIEDAIPAIVSRDDWNTVNARMKRRSNKGRKIKKQTYLLSGILYCSECNGLMNGHAQRKKSGYEYWAYECSTHVKNSKACRQKSIRMDRIETAVLDYLKQLLAPASIEKIRDYMLTHMELINANITGELQAYNEEVKKLKAKSDRAIDLLLEGDMPKEAIKRKLDEYENRIAILESKIAQLKAQQITPEKIEKELNICIKIDELTREEQQKVIRKIIKKITISNAGDGDQRTVEILTIPALFYSYVGGATPNKVKL